MLGTILAAATAVAAIVEPEPLPYAALIDRDLAARIETGVEESPEPLIQSLLTRDLIVRQEWVEPNPLLIEMLRRIDPCLTVECRES